MRMLHFLLNRMLKHRLPSQKVDWHDLEMLFSEVTLRSARRECRLSAIVSSLEKSAKVSLARLSQPLRFQTEDSEISVKRSTSQIGDLELRSVCRSFLPLLFVQKDGRCHLRFAGDLLAEFVATSRWIGQQLMQVKGQSWFLAFFVPVVSLLFVLSSWQRFVANISGTMGLLVLIAAVASYALGCASLGLLFGRQKRLLVSASLAQTAGQTALLRELATAGQRPGESLSALSRALSLGTNSSAQQLSAMVLFSLALPQGGASSKSSFHSKFELDFISQLQGGYLRSSPCAREKWLIQAQRALLQSLKREAAVETAKLSLWLLAVMAIFFLPALFLMLGLSGMSFGPVTIG